MKKTIPTPNSLPTEPIEVMQRRELKYLLSPEQARLLKQAMAGRMEPDLYGKTTIASLYYDTPDHRLIRSSLEKPDFKEKLRLRSYGRASQDSPVYLEMKRKALDTVYKRRVQTTVDRVPPFLQGADNALEPGQISRELGCFRDLYPNLGPSCMIIYDRTAYAELEGDLRLTIDENPRYRIQDLDLTRPMEGKPLLREGWSILELKIQGAMPLWLARTLSRGKIYKTSFSKYGEAYRRELSQRNLRSAG